MAVNAVSLADRLWPNNECWIGSFVIFQGIRAMQRLFTAFFVNTKATQGRHLFLIHLAYNYSQWLNSVIYCLINHCTDWARTGVTSFVRQFYFHGVIFVYGIETLTIDGVTSFLQLLDVQNIRRNTRFSLKTSCEKL